jgi:hypothetical protein
MHPHQPLVLCSVRGLVRSAFLLNWMVAAAEKIHDWAEGPPAGTARANLTLPPLSP